MASLPGIARLSTLEDAIEHLENVAPIHDKMRHTNVAELTGKIASYAYENGIPSGLLARLVKVISKPNYLGQSVITTLIKNLYPCERVPSRIVSRVVCSLGPSKTKPSLATQELLLRWLILVHEEMEDQFHLLKLYSVLFGYLDMISWRKSLCHLLSLITRRKHVKPYRVQFLMELMRKSGDEDKELQGLFLVFKSYNPDIIIGDTQLTRGRTSYFFRHPDLEWQTHSKALLEQASRINQAPLAFQVVRRGPIKRGRVETAIPAVQTSRVPPNFSSLEEVRNFRDFVEKFDKIELPNQIASALTDPLARKYLHFVQNKNATRRLESWLRAFFDDELERHENGELSEELGFVLESLVSYVRFTKTMPKALVSFIHEYLPIWNGKHHVESILQLMEYIPANNSDFDDLNRVYFNHLQNALVTPDLKSLVILLQYYTSLIRCWSSFIRCGISPWKPPLTELIEKTEILALNILMASNSGDPMVAFPVLRLYTTLANIFTHAPGNSAIKVSVPPPQTIYFLAFIPSLTHISSLGSILALYKSAFEESLTSTALQATPERLYPSSAVSRFNGYVIDMCNLLWRNRALNLDDPNALGCLIPPATLQTMKAFLEDINKINSERSSGDDNMNEAKYVYHLPSLFSLSYNFALSGISAACVRELEKEAEMNGETVTLRLRVPVTQKVLATLARDGGVKVNWQEYRLKMLDWLDERGAGGIGDLMRSTMKALRK